MRFAKAVPITKLKPFAGNPRVYGDVDIAALVRSEDWAKGNLLRFLACVFDEAAGPFAVCLKQDLGIPARHAWRILGTLWLFFTLMAHE